MQTQLVPLTDGEIENDTDADSTTKLRNARAYRPPITLWDRPYPDPMDSDHVELYLDGHPDGYYYVLSRRYEYINQSWTQRYTNGPYVTIQQAEEQGYERYSQILKEAQGAAKAQREGYLAWRAHMATLWHKWAPPAVFLLCSLGLAIALVIKALSH